MHFEGLIGIDRIVLGFRAVDKVQALSEVTRSLGNHLRIAPPAVLLTILAREQLGSTGLGRGFALPHARMPGVEKTSGFLMRLARPIEFESIDRLPVDIIFLLIMPAEKSNEQISALASVARSLRNQQLLDAIRKAKTTAELFDYLSSAAA